MPWTIVPTIIPLVYKSNCINKLKYKLCRKDNKLKTIINIVEKALGNKENIKQIEVKQIEFQNLSLKYLLTL